MRTLVVAVTTLNLSLGLSSDPTRPTSVNGDPLGVVQHVQLPTLSFSKLQTSRRSCVGPFHYLAYVLVSWLQSFGVTVIRPPCPAVVRPKFRLPQFWSIRVQNAAIMRTLIGEVCGPSLDVCLSSHPELTPSVVGDRPTSACPNPVASGASKCRPRDP